MDPLKDNKMKLLCFQFFYLQSSVNESESITEVAVKRLQSLRAKLNVLQRKRLPNYYKKKAAMRIEKYALS